MVIAEAFRQHGCQLIHVVSGQTSAQSVSAYGRGFLTSTSDRIRNEVGIPTMVGGHIVTSDEANTVLAAGHADFCIMTANEVVGD